MTSPGPWSVDAQSSLPRIVSADRVIAAVFSGNGPGATRDTALADAHLMAAASETLNVLRDVINYYEPRVLTREVVPRDEGNPLARALAVIAKAEWRTEP